VATNRAAYGVRIRVVLTTPEGERTIHRTVGTGGSFGSSPIRQEIGLGPVATIDRVEIFWPVPGDVQEVRGLFPDNRYHVRQGEDA